MSSLELRRIQATQRVMKALARLSAREALPVVLPDGSTPVVVTIPEERVSDMVARLDRAGGHANVVIDYVDYFSVADFASNDFPSAGAGDDLADVHQLSTVGLLIDWLKLQPDSAGEFRMTAGCSDAVVEPSHVRKHEYQF